MPIGFGFSIIPDLKLGKLFKKDESIMETPHHSSVTSWRRIRLIVSVWRSCLTLQETHKDTQFQSITPWASLGLGRLKLPTPMHAHKHAPPPITQHYWRPPQILIRSDFWVGLVHWTPRSPCQAPPPLTCHLRLCSSSHRSRLPHLPWARLCLHQVSSV